MTGRDQDTNQKEKLNQTEEHDESVLNPEIRNETDLSRKERRLIEKEKLKGMGFKKKLEYIWMYYKPAIFGVIAAIVLVFVAKDYYENAKIQTVLSISVVNATINDADAVEQEILDTIGYADDKYSEVGISTNLMTGTEEDEFDYAGQMAYVAQIQAGSIDVMVMPEKLYQKLNESEPFVNLEELLGEDVFKDFGEQTDNTHISVTDSRLAEKLGVGYEPMCIAVLCTAENQENAAEWIKTLVSDN